MTENVGNQVGDHSFDEAEIRKILRDSESSVGFAEFCHRHGIDEEMLLQWKRKYGSQSSVETGMEKLEEENRNLKQIVAGLMLEKRALLQHRVSFEQSQGAAVYCGLTDSEQDASIVLHPDQGSLHFVGKPATGQDELAPQATHVEVGADTVSGMHQNVRSLLERSRIIPAIRSSEFIPAAIASPALVVSLLYGSLLTIGDIMRKLRSAGKLPIANLDLLTGFAQDSDAVSLLVKLGVAGIVSTRQSVLRAASAQGIIAVQRTFAVDSIALHNITRALHHFVPHAIELLPAVAAPLAMPSLRAAKPELPVIATGLVNSLRQVEELVGHGVTSVATSNASLWIL